MYCIVTVMRFVIILIKFYVYMYVCTVKMKILYSTIAIIQHHSACQLKLN